MKNVIRHPLTLLVVALLLLALGVNYLTSQRLGDYTSEVSSDVTAQRVELERLATLSARNGSDELSEAVLIDCSPNERERFDFLLDSLDQNLDQTALAELDSLFGRCGAHFAERRALVATRLEREVVIYEELLNQLNQLTNGQNQKEELALWQELVRLENQRSALYKALVNSQDNIIQALRNSNSLSADSVVEASQAAREIQENLLLASTQAGTVRQQLLPE